MMVPGVIPSLSPAVTRIMIAATTTCAPGAAASPKIGDLKSAEAMRGESREQGREGRRVERERERERKNKRARGERVGSLHRASALGPCTDRRTRNVYMYPPAWACCSGADWQNS